MYDELIAALRICASSGSCEACPNCADGKCKSNGVFGGWDGLFHDAADALEAAEKRIDGLQKLVDINTERCEALRKQLREAHKSYEKHINELEAQLPKEGAWVWENYCWHCSVCGENPTRGMGYVQGKNELFKVCPNCGAKMRTVTDCHTLEEGE